MKFILKNNNGDLINPSNNAYQKGLKQLVSILLYFQVKYPCIKFKVEPGRYGYADITLEPIDYTIKKSIFEDIYNVKYLSEDGKHILNTLFFEQ